MPIDIYQNDSFLNYFLKDLVHFIYIDDNHTDDRYFYFKIEFKNIQDLFVLRLNKDIILASCFNSLRLLTNNCMGIYCVHSSTYMYMQQTFCQYCHDQISNMFAHKLNLTFCIFV